MIDVTHDSGTMQQRGNERTSAGLQDCRLADGQCHAGLSYSLASECINRGVKKTRTEMQP